MRSGEKKNIRTGVVSWLAWRDAALEGLVLPKAPKLVDGKYE